MADRPILFSAPMVRALLEGRKTQTRRVLKPQPQGVNIIGIKWPDGTLDCDGRRLRFAPGDRLWVKETFAEVGAVDPPFTIFRATYAECCRRHQFDRPPPENEVRWKPSIFMPRRLSRLTLLVTDVRVERLQDISEADAIAEGCRGSSALIGEDVTAARAYKLLWNSINGPGAWEANPWVVAVSFEVRRGNIDD